jgi:hypothetical protein
MQNNKLLIKKTTRKYVAFRKSSVWGRSSALSVKNVNALLLRGNDQINQDVYLKTLFGGSIDRALPTADWLAHAIRDMGSLTQMRTVLNGMTPEHGTVGDSGSTGRSRTHAAGNAIFQGILGFDRHGVIERDAPAGSLRHNGAEWDDAGDELPRLSQLIHIIRRLDGTIEKIPIDRREWPISPSTRSVVMDFLNAHYPESDTIKRRDILDEISNKLESTGSGGYSDPEIIDIMSKAVVNKNRKDSEELWGDTASAQAKSLLDKHFLSPHFYLYDHDEAYPEKDASGATVLNQQAAPIQAFKDIILSLSPRHVGETAASRRILTVRPGETYATPAMATEQRWASLLSALRPANAISHRQGRDISTIPHDTKVSLASSYAPFDRGNWQYNLTHAFTGIDPEWSDKVAKTGLQKTSTNWDAREALQLAGEIYRRSRRKYASEVLEKSFKDISDKMGFSSAVPFQPYDRYITGAGDVENPLVGPSTMLSKVRRIFTHPSGTSPTLRSGSVFSTTLLPTLKEAIGSVADRLSWLHMDPQEFVEDTSGSGLKVLRIQSGLPFFEYQAHRAKMDLTDYMTLSSSRGAAYTWRQTNITHNHEAGDEHALILDCLRALHQDGYDHREASTNDDIFGLIHNILVKFRSSSGPSSRHRMINFIDQFNAIRNDPEKSKLMDLGMDSDGKIITPLEMVKSAAQKRLEYLDAVQAWKGDNSEKSSRDKKPLPQQENTLFHHLLTLNPEAFEAFAAEKDTGIRIPKTLSDYEKYIARALSVNSLSASGTESSKKLMYKHMIYPFLKKAFAAMKDADGRSIEMTIPGTGLPIPDSYDPKKPSDWGADETQRRRNMDLVFHLTHQIVKATVGNEICHWCDGTGIITPQASGSDHARYCRNCNVHDPKNPRQLLAPQSEQDKQDALDGIVPVWDHVHVGTYHNGSTASQLTPRFTGNYLTMLAALPEIKKLFTHPTVIDAVTHFIKNPALYHPLEISPETVDHENAVLDDVRDTGTAGTAPSAAGTTPSAAEAASTTSVAGSRVRPPAGSRPPEPLTPAAAPPSPPKPAYNIIDSLHEHIL